MSWYSVWIIWKTLPKQKYLKIRKFSEIKTSYFSFKSDLTRINAFFKMSRFTSKANFWKHLGQCSWEELVFRDRRHLETQEANIALLTNCSLLLKNFWVKRSIFFLPVNFVVFQQRSKDMLQQALVWLLHWKYKNSRMQSASLFFPRALCSPNLAVHTLYVWVCVRPQAHGGNCNSTTISGACISHQVVLMEESQPCWWIHVYVYNWEKGHRIPFMMGQGLSSFKL